MDKLQNFEKEIDLYYNSYNPTTDNEHLETWRILTVYEDYLYFHAMEYIKRNISSQSITDSAHLMKELEDHKLNLKLYLKLISLKCNDKTASEKDEYFNGEKYLHIGKTIKITNSYMYLNWGVISTYKNLSKFSYRNSKYDFTNNIDYSKSMVLQQYSRTEATNINKNMNNSGLGFLLSFIAIDNKSELFNSFLETSKTINNNIKYTFEINLLHTIHEKLIDSKTLDIPESWIFPWSSSSDFRKYFIALNSICVYHFACILVNSSQYGIAGGGLEQRVICLGKNELYNLIYTVTRLPMDTIVRITNYMTFGFSTKSPDPALQPIFVKNDEVMLAPFLITSLSFDRNALSLHLRLDEKHFNTNSELFEKDMTNRFLKSIPDNYKYVSNFHLPNKEGGEIDVALIDEKSKTIIIYELKWMLTPSDPNEVFHKIIECQKKIEQADKKLVAAKENVNFLLDKFKLYNQKSTEWRVQSLVIIEGFSGVNSNSQLNTLIIPIWIHEKIVNCTDSLNEMHNFITSKLWQPQETIHYRKVRHKFKFAGKKISIDGINIFNIDDYFISFITKSLEEFRFNAKLIN